MFLRRYERRKNGKPHTYWALAESYRTAQGSRQRIVASLGELNAHEQDGWAQLSSHLHGEAKTRRPQPTLFDPPRCEEPRDEEPLLVKLCSIRPQVCIGLVVTEDGFPLGYEVFAGNTHDSTTVKTIIESREKKYGSLNRVWVMDRGLVSEENLKFLRARGGQYIVGTPKSMRHQFEQHLTEKDWASRAANSGWKSLGNALRNSATGQNSPTAATCSAVT